MEPKPGYRTTEFWLSLIAMLVGVALASGLVSNEFALQALGFVQSTLAAIGYAGCRGWVKSSTAKAGAVAALPTPPR